MFEVLLDMINVPKRKTTPTSTVSKPQINTPSTIQEPQIDFNIVDLFPFDEQEDDNDILVKFLDSTESQIKTTVPQNQIVPAMGNPSEVPTTTHNKIQTFNQNVNTSNNRQFLPMMHFPHSNVTINYNFNYPPK